MTDGSSQGLFIIVAVVIFGIFVAISYLLFRDKLQIGLANIFNDSTEEAQDGLGGKENESNGSNKFLNSSTLNFEGRTNMYMGGYLFGNNGESGEPINLDKFEKNGNDYVANYTIDASKYYSYNGGKDWDSLLITDDYSFNIELDDSDKNLIDSEYLSNNLNGNKLSINWRENPDGNNVQIMLTNDKREYSIKQEIPMADGSYSTITVNLKAINDVKSKEELDEFKNNYTSKFTLDLVFTDGTNEVDGFTLTTDTNNNAYVLDTEGKFDTIKNKETYWINFRKAYVTLKDSEDYYLLNGTSTALTYNKEGEYNLGQMEAPLLDEDGNYVFYVTPSTDLFYGNEIKVIIK